MNLRIGNLQNFFLVCHWKDKIIIESTIPARCCQRKESKCSLYVLFASPLMIALFLLSSSTGLSLLHNGYRETITFEVWHNHQTIGILGFRGGERLLISCQLVLVEGRDEAKKPEILRELSQSFRTIHEVEFDLMLSIVQSCQDLQTHRMRARNPGKNNQPEGTVNLWAALNGIVPGTKWCGVDDIAENYHDLGENFELDKCCRAHDHCPVKVKSFTSKYGATNNHPYTKSHCSCDELFYKCLKEIREEKESEKAATVGKVFFNILRLECAEPRYPRICLESKPRDDPQGTSDIGNLSGRANSTLIDRLFFGQNDNDNIERRDVCTRYIDDLDAAPILVFRKPQRNF